MLRYESNRIAAFSFFGVPWGLQEKSCVEANFTSDIIR